MRYCRAAFSFCLLVLDRYIIAHCTVLVDCQTSVNPALNYHTFREHSSYQNLQHFSHLLKSTNSSRKNRKFNLLSARALEFDLVHEDALHNSHLGASLSLPENIQLPVVTKCFESCRDSSHVNVSANRKCVSFNIDQCLVLLFLDFQMDSKNLIDMYYTAPIAVA